MSNELHDHPGIQHSPKKPITSRRGGTPLSDAEKKYVDINYKTVSVHNMGIKFNRKSVKVFYDYMKQRGMEPFIKGRTPSKIVTPPPNGIFVPGTGDWLTGTNY